MRAPHETTSRPRGVYRPELDGLRFFAFLAVFLHHALPDSPDAWMAQGASPGVAHWLTSAVIAGSLGVDFFLCLSAYLITELLVRERELHGEIAYGPFLARRALRIWPLYYTFLAFVFVVWPLFGPDRPLTPRQLLAFATFFSNWECALHGYPTSILAPLWSIALEEQFYLLFPLVMRLRASRDVVRVLVAMIAIALCARAIVVRAALPAGSQMLWCNTFTRLDPIAIGALLAIGARGRAPRWSGAVRVLAKVAAIATLLLVAHRLPLHRDPIDYAAVPAFTLTALACGLLVASTLRDADAPKGPLARPALVWLGQRSYGLYVFHMLGLVGARALLESLDVVASLSSTVALAFALTLAMAATSHRWLEAPFLRLKARFTRAVRPLDSERVPSSA